MHAKITKTQEEYRCHHCAKRRAVYQEGPTRSKLSDDQARYGWTDHPSCIKRCRVQGDGVGKMCIAH
uniref:Protein of unassigned function n=1 Tax=Methylobacterium oryzae CBMB20 TaxID=693986 RepID=A0A088B2A4_9HYPH|nr:protein of unassigned function [Methylobacterium oryzae CBMB20]